MPENYAITHLPSGLKVVAAPLRDMKSVSVGIWVHAGGRNESARQSGVSHFLEHLVFKGTQKRTTQQIKESIEGVGGSMNAFTSEEYTCFLAKVARRHFENVFEVLADMVLEAALAESEIEKERAVILEEIKMTQDQPGHLADELLTEIVWPDHALGRPLAGTIASVNALTRDDIRKYRDAFYRPRALTVSAAGSIDQKTLVRETRRHFSSAPADFHEKSETFKPRQSKPAFKLLTKSTEQTHLALAVHAFPKDHPDEHVLDILNVILGGNMSSRLFNEVREERGLAYDVGSFVRRYQDTGAFTVSAGVDNQKIGEALRVILKELQKTAREGVKAGELRRAKDFYLGQFELGLENSMNHMLWVGENAVTLDKCPNMRSISKAVEKVTPNDLKRVAKTIFRTNALNLAAVGPSLPAEDFEKILHFD